tara:strand:+ start:385 stop:645 length:261 start_codon:yes stop_codon:yes gene_type:complete
MEKIIFFGLVIPIMGFVLYLGATAIMKGFDAKEANRSENKEDLDNIELSNDISQLSNEITKLNELHKSGALSQEEFEKAKKKLLKS